MTLSDEAIPCPFCGSDNLDRNQVGNSLHWVFCLDCNCCGPDADNLHNAINRWNRRPEVEA